MPDFESLPIGPSPIEQFPDPYQQLLQHEPQPRPEQLDPMLAVQRINDGQGQERIQQYYGKETLGRINRASTFFEGAGLEDQVDALDFPDTLGEEVSKIASRLGEHGPDEIGGQPNRDAVYLKQFGRGEFTGYTVNTRKLSKDMEFLRNLRGISTPQQVMYIDRLGQSLQGYGWYIDPHAMAMQQLNEAHSNSPTTRAAGKGLRMVGILAGGTLAILNGVISYKSNTASITPFLYAALALFSLDPTILDGKAKHTVQQATRAIDTLRRDDLIRQPGIAGVAENVMHDGVDNGFLRILRANKQLTKEQREQFNDGFNNIVPENASPALRNALLASQNNRHLAETLNTLRGVRDPDAQDLVQAYLQNEAWRLGV
ncbi:MAG: hypothetical protein G01um101425_608 [Candidatus Peregrinibacteria bacterium Gr01-1014_25]|nr:MAG: hypothetical protein G01um101425_608 [Candidatus Peregrinibacteria bacterium Gr01-1014_25]